MCTMRAGLESETEGKKRERERERERDCYSFYIIIFEQITFFFSIFFFPFFFIFLSSVRACTVVGGNK